METGVAGVVVVVVPGVVAVVVPPVVTGLLVPITVVVSPAVVVVTPPVAVVVDGATWVSGDVPTPIPGDGPMITGAVPAVATPAPTRTSATTTAFWMLRVMRFPSCELMRRRFAIHVPSRASRKDYIGRRISRSVADIAP